MSTFPQVYHIYSPNLPYRICNEMGIIVKYHLKTTLWRFLVYLIQEREEEVEEDLEVTSGICETVEIDGQETRELLSSEDPDTMSSVHKLCRHISYQLLCIDNYIFVHCV